MYQFVLLIHVFVAICIIGLVLIQQGKGATMGAAFGSGASQTVFGSRGSGSFLFRVTVSFIAVFFITSIGLNYLGVHAFKQQSNIPLPVMPIKQHNANPTAPASSNNNSVATQPLSAPVLPINGIPKRN
jgi:preprotein translocase subunit SecG